MEVPDGIPEYNSLEQINLECNRIIEPGAILDEIEENQQNVMVDGLLVTCCKFHYCQNMMKKMKSLDFTRLFRLKKSFSTWFRKIMAVPLLPHYQMGAMYEELLSQTFNFTNPYRYGKFDILKTYIRTFCNIIFLHFYFSPEIHINYHF